MSTQPNPENFPSYRPPSRKSGPAFISSNERSAAGAAFQTGADEYDDVRPGYPDDVAQLLADCSSVVDLGAGTGKLTSLLGTANGNNRVLAIDPSHDMCSVLRRNLDVPVWRATAEHTALADDSVDAVAVGQAWHWFDVEAVCKELDRVVAADGKVVLVWNTLAVETDPWILRLSRIMHSGDVHKAGFVPDIAPPWSIAEELRLVWQQSTTPERLHQLMHTRAYWLRSKEPIRQRMTHNLNWYLFEHMGFRPRQELVLPYRTDAFVLMRSTPA